MIRWVLFVVVTGTIVATLQFHFYRGKSGLPWKEELDEHILMLERLETLKNASAPDPRTIVNEVLRPWALSEESILENQPSPEIHSKLYNFLQSLLYNLTTQDHMLETSIDELFALTQIMRQKPRANVSLLAPCAAKHIDKAIPFMTSVLMQTVLPAETLMVFSVPEKVESELSTGVFANLGMPQFRVFLRGGLHYAGDNRLYLSRQSKYEINTFFDCDDFMHPQRTEVISMVFDSHPELESALHAYVSRSRNMFTDGGLNHFFKTYGLSADAILNWRMKWKYPDFWYQKPIIHYNNSADTWIANDPHTEPNHSANISQHWFYGKGISLTPKALHAMHNGWVTVRKRIFDFVPYPDLRRGQDALFNWRTLRNQRNFTIIDFVLGAYLKKKKI